MTSWECLQVAVNSLKHLELRVKLGKDMSHTTAWEGAQGGSAAGWRGASERVGEKVFKRGQTRQARCQDNFIHQSPALDISKSRSYRSGRSWLGSDSGSQ